MTAEDIYQTLLSEANETQVIEAANFISKSKSIENGIINSLGLGVALIGHEDVNNLKLMFAVVYLIGYQRAQWEALEALTRP